MILPCVYFSRASEVPRLRNTVHFDDHFQNRENIRFVTSKITDLYKNYTTYNVTDVFLNTYPFLPHLAEKDTLKTGPRGTCPISK